MIHDILQGFQFAKVFRFYFRRMGQLFTQYGKYLHPFDGVDTQVIIKGHAQFKHLNRISGGFGYGLKQNALDLGLARIGDCGLGPGDFIFFTRCGFRTCCA